ncbi:MAG: hypothetical protein H7Y31_00055 [Chitinophagaceae bacterium]|nr:hypothetical protein [Chitinophagaceae bacterium]
MNFRQLFHLTLFVSLSFDISCKKKSSTNPSSGYSDTPVAVSIPSGLEEASGIADSYANNGCLWVEQDSGNPPALSLLGHDGVLRKTIPLRGATNTDWEDITVSNGPDASKKYIYIGDFGDNNAVRSKCSIYRFEEPLLTLDSVRAYDKIEFSYADGPRDAESLIIDPNSKDIYIITKRETKSRVYKLSFPYSVSNINTANFVSELPYKGVTSAALRVEGGGLIIKTYSSIYLYSNPSGNTLPTTLAGNYTTLGYVVEQLGEAVTFKIDGSGFFTLSEKGPFGSQSLNFYKKK